MRRSLRIRALAAIVLAAALAALSGCATIRPYEREYLSDRIMDSAREEREGLVDQKWLEAREGSTGGAVGAGGGCACN
jgi:hypothetical protein